jgi:hypothetical protein
MPNSGAAQALDASASHGCIIFLPQKDGQCAFEHRSKRDGTIRFTDIRVKSSPETVRMRRKMRMEADLLL